MRNDDNPHRWTCAACGIQSEIGALQAHLCPGKIQKRPDRPTDEQCAVRIRVPDFKGWAAHAAWLPDGARAVIVVTETGYEAHVWRGDRGPTIEPITGDEVAALRLGSD